MPRGPCQVGSVVGTESGELVAHATSDLGCADTWMCLGVFGG